MIRVIKTPAGQLLADQKNGTTTIIDPVTYKPVALLNTIDHREVLGALRRVGSILRIKKTLELMGVTVYPDAVSLTPSARRGETLDSESESEGAPKPVRRAAAAKAAKARPVVEEEEEYEEEESEEEAPRPARRAALLAKAAEPRAKKPFPDVVLRKAPRR